MKLTAIIAEYNPLHSGHIYHINEARKLGNPLFAVQSGSFVQRGECACLDKYDRAFSAVKNGIQTVFELPAPFAFAPADKFALGAFRVLSEIDADITLSFGSESGDIEEIEQTAHILLTEPRDFKNLLKNNLENGYNFNKSRFLALNEYARENKLRILDVSKPNNILAVEYAKLNEKNSYPLKLHTVKRMGNYKGNNDNEYKSASEIRELFKANKQIDDISIPEETRELLKMRPFFDNDILFLYEVIKSEKSRLQTIFDVSEGLENRLKKQAFNSTTTQELIKNVSNARYTESRIRRILTNLLFGITNEVFDKCMQEETVANVLASEKDNPSILKAVKTNILASQNDLLNSELVQSQLTYQSQAIFKIIRGYSNQHAIFI